MENNRGEEISIFARIVSIGDAFDALTSTRPYRKGVGVHLAMEALEAETLKPVPETHSIDRFVSRAPEWVIL